MIIPVPSPSVVSVFVENIELPVSFSYDIPTTLSMVCSNVFAIV